MSGPLGVRARAEWDLLNRAVALNDVPCTNDPAPWHGSAKEQESAAVRCMDCPVMLLCAQYAVAAKEPHGTWGGMTEHDRSRPDEAPRAPVKRRKPRATYPAALRERAAALRDGGASLRSIAATLTDEGFPTARGKPWHPSTVASVLKAATLTGTDDRAEKD